jgi:hypothetical protein
MRFRRFLRLFIPKMLSGTNAFEISDIQERNRKSVDQIIEMLHRCIASKNLPPYQFARGSSPTTPDYRHLPLRRKGCFRVAGSAAPNGSQSNPVAV